MEILKILLISICATSIMTLFSYMYEDVNRGRFKEPQLLNSLTKFSTLPFSPHRSNMWGWVLHYLIGLVFVVGFEILIDSQIIVFSLENALFYGFVIGLIGIGGWETMFRVNKRPKNFNALHYYRHLLVAHLLFGISLGFFSLLWHKYIV
jgi:hypothetical protein